MMLCIKFFVLPDAGYQHYKILSMKSLKNSVQLIGHLGSDVEFKELESGRKFSKFSLATNEYYKNSEGEKVQNTQWHNITAWGNLAENMHEYLKKGNLVAIRGKIEYRTYENKEGEKKYFTEINAAEFISMSKKTEVPF